MIYINLLPEEKKGQINRKKNFWSIFRQEIMFFFVLIFFSAILYSINIILDMEMLLVEQTTKGEIDKSEYKELREYENKFKNTNEQVATLVNIEKNHLYWTVLLEDLSQKKSNGITIKEVTNNNFDIIIRGEADTRDNLMSFQEALNKNKCYTDINVPLSNLVMKSDIAFVMNFKIEEDCLKNKK